MQRKTYFFLTFATMALGLFVRKMLWGYLPFWINIWIGDFIWATMLYFACTTVFYHKTIQWRVIVMLIGCCFVETSQLFHTEWLDAFRHTTFGGLLLGHGFLWSDIVANIGGILFGGWVSRFYN